MKDENRRFGMVMAAGFLVIGIVRYFSTGHITWWLLAIAVAWFLVALAVPPALTPVRIVWMKVGHILGLVNGRIILTLLFIVVITPVALLMRLLGKQPIARRVSSNVQSYWRPRGAEEFLPQRMERQF